MFQASEALSKGEIVYMTVNGQMAKAVATAAAISRAWAMAVEDINANAFGPFLLRGFARFDSNFPTYTVVGVLYTPEAEQNNPNVPTQTAPSTDGDFVQCLGISTTADTVLFMPSLDVIEVG